MHKYKLASDGIKKLLDKKDFSRSDTCLLESVAKDLDLMNEEMIFQLMPMVKFHQKFVAEKLEGNLEAAINTLKYNLSLVKARKYEDINSLGILQTTAITIDNLAGQLGSWVSLYELLIGHKWERYVEKEKIAQ